MLASVMHAAGRAWLWGTVLALMQSCKTLYHEGTRLLLTETVHLRTHDLISSFSHFILHAESTLLSQFRNRLSIWVDDEDPSPPDGAFVSAVSRSVHLRSLHIHNLDPLLRAYPDLSTVFLSLPALEDLFIQTMVIARHQLIAKFLRGLRCPLKSIRLQCFVEDHGKNIDYRREADPLWLFAGVASTLETFSFCGFIQMGTTHLYPNVKKLHVLVEPTGTPILRPFITSFPALRTLVSVPPPCALRYAEMDRFMIDYTLEGHWAPKNENFGIWEHFREANRRDQLIYGSWDTLDTLISNSLIARTLGLLCHVRRVHLLLQFDPENVRVIMTVGNVLRDTRPDCLRLAFYRLDLEIVLDMMERLIYVQNNLSALELRLNICEGSFDAKQYLVRRRSSSRRCHSQLSSDIHMQDQLAHALKQSVITSLRVELVCFKGQFHRVVTECQERHWLERISDYCIMEDTIRMADIRTFVHHFIATVRNLRRMEVMWGCCYLPYGLDGGGVGIDLDVGPEVYDIPAEDHPDDWDATW